MSSVITTWRTYHPTVRGPMNSPPPIAGFDRPLPACPAICASRAGSGRALGSRRAARPELAEQRLDRGPGGGPPPHRREDAPPQPAPVESPQREPVSLLGAAEHRYERHREPADQDARTTFRCSHAPSSVAPAHCCLPPMHKRGATPSRAGGRLVLVHSGRPTLVPLDARNTPKAAVTSPRRDFDSNLGPHDFRWSPGVLADRPRERTWLCAEAGS
jgi:hypothetical protein